MGPWATAGSAAFVARSFRPGDAAMTRYGIATPDTDGPVATIPADVLDWLLVLGMDTIREGDPGVNGATAARFLDVLQDVNADVQMDREARLHFGANPCATCGRADVVDGPEPAAHWNTPNGATIVAWTCSDACSDAFEAARA